MNKNVLIYNYNEPLPEQGGMERVTDILAAELKKADCNVFLLCAVKNRLNKRYQAPVDIFYLPQESPDKFIIDLVDRLKICVIIDQTEGGLVGPNGYFKKRPEALSYAALLAVQHSSTRAVLRNATYIYGKSGVNLIGNIKAWLYNNTVLKVRYLHFLYHAWRVNRNLDKNYDRTILLSDSFIADFLHYYPFANKSKLLAIPNPNTFESTVVSSKEKRALFVGRLKNNPKGVDKLLRIWSRVEKNISDWTLDIVGDGEDRESMEVFSKELGLKNVVFHGFQNPAPFYQRASIFCMTSIYEGFGMVLTEAMQHGVIPMAFDSYSAAKDIIKDKQNGYLIPPYNEEEYAEKLIGLMHSAEQREQMSKSALIHSKQFSRSSITNQWLKLINSL